MSNETTTKKEKLVMPRNTYYYPEMDLDGTAEELFIQARNGYIESPEALAKIQEILLNPLENESKKAFYVSILKEIAEDEGKEPYVFAQMKKDVMDGLNPEEVTLRDGLNLEVRREQENILIALREYGETRIATGATVIPEKQFLSISAKEFTELVNSVYAYNMVGEECEPESDPEPVRNPFNERNFKIQPLTDGSLAVRSDSDWFGDNEIVYQGATYEECLHYIDEREDCITPHYYVIKDLATWRSDVWENTPERSKVERFDMVEEAVAAFNAYKEMDYLKQDIIDPQTGRSLHRLALGVSYVPIQFSEMDLLHVENSKVLLLSDAIEARQDGYEKFMINSKFIRDLNKIVSEITIDEYSYYRDSTIEELAADRLVFLNEHYPDESHSKEEAMLVAEEFLRRHPDWLKNNQVNERTDFKDFKPSFLKRDTGTNDYGESETITLHIRYKEPVNVNGWSVETDSVVFGNMEEFRKYINGEVAYDILDDSVKKKDNEILLYAANENGDILWDNREV